MIYVDLYTKIKFHECSHLYVVLCITFLKENIDKWEGQLGRRRDDGPTNVKDGRKDRQTDRHNIILLIHGISMSEKNLPRIRGY